MHGRNCNCAACAGGELEEYPLSEADEVELAMELLSVASEAEMDQFLGKLVKKAWRGVKKVGSFVGKVAKPFAGVLKSIAKKALPFVGGALGSLIPIPGVGTAVGSALGGALSKALELETSGMSSEDREFEMARRFVRLAATAAQSVADASPDMGEEEVLNEAFVSAARRHLPQFPLTGGTGGAVSGRWIRRGRHIVVLGA